MKNLILYSAIFLAFALVIGFMFVHVPVSQDLSDGVTPARAPAPAVKSASLPTPEPNIASATLPSSTPKPAPAPTNDNAYEEPPAPGTVVLTIPGAPGEAGIPVAMVIKDADPNLSPDQKARIDAISQSFTKEMTSGYVNPYDPNYLARWQKAQAEADTYLKLTVGEQDYLKYSLEAGRMSSNQ